MKFTQIPTDTFKQLQLNAGIVCQDFDPTDGSVDDVIGATTGGINFQASPSFIDFGEDVDNCPKNTKELKRIDEWTATMSGTFVTLTQDSAVLLTGAADKSGTTKIVPRQQLDDDDFTDIWFVGDYSDLNGATNGGFCAIHLMNGLSTGGFQIQSADKAKGQFSFEFTGHYSIEAMNTVPFEIYVKAGSAEPTTP